MAEKTLESVNSILDEIISSYAAVQGCLVCTKEGEVISHAFRESELEPTRLSTVAAALMYSGRTAYSQMFNADPSVIIQATSFEYYLLFRQEDFSLVVILTKDLVEDNDLEPFIHDFNEYATSIQSQLLSISTYEKNTLLGELFSEVSKIKQALLLTVEGLPLASRGFQDETEISAVLSAIYANCQTLSMLTEFIVIEGDKDRIIIFKVDDKRLLALVSAGESLGIIINQVKRVLREST